MPIDNPIQTEESQETSLKDYFNILLKRRYIIVSFFIAVTGISAIYNLRMPDIYMASSQILIQEPGKSIGRILPETRFFSFNISYISTQLEIMKSTPVISAVVEKLNLTSRYPQVLGADQKSAAKKIAGMISIDQVGDSRVFYVNVKSTNPRLSADVANGLVDAYVENRAITSLLLSKDLVNKWFPESGGKVKIETIYGKLKELSRDEMIQSLPSVAADPKIVELKMKREKLERDLSAYLKKYTEKHPKIISTRNELQRTKEEIKVSAENIVNEIKDSVEGKFLASNVKVVEYAEVPAGPIGPNRMKNFLLATVMGLFLGCGLALFVDYLDNTVKMQEDVEKRLKLPYLGYIPLFKGKFGFNKKGGEYVIVNPDDHKSSFMEALRNIRMSIIFSAPPDSLRSILITSAIPKEGKSTIALNLAINIATDGTNTLLVDGDMRRPNLHKMLGLKNSMGLSNYLTSKISIESVLEETKFKNLKFVACGPIPPNPTGLFSSYRMKEFVNEAKARFDKIIFDGPPVLGIADSIVLAKSLDGLIQIIRFGKVTWDIANKFKRRLQSLGIEITGVIINGVDTTKDSYYYKYYDYSYYKYY